MRFAARPYVIVSLVVAAAASGAAGATPAPQQERTPEILGQRPVFGADVSMVMVNVSVLDGEGLPVAGLTADDFILLEDGVPQRVSVVLNPNEVPVDLVILMDISGSVLADQIAMKRDAVTLLKALEPDDCVCFMTFGNTISEGTWGRPDDEALRDTIVGTQVKGWTPLYDALIVAIERIEQASDECGRLAVTGAGGRGAGTGDTDNPPQERRKAIVVITDGGDTSSQAQFAAAVNAASMTSVPIFPVAVGTALTEGQGANIGAEARRQVQASTPGSDATVKSREEQAGDPVTERINEFDHTTRVARQSAQQRWEARRTSYGRGLADSLQEFADISGGKYVNGGESAASLRIAYNELLTWLRSSYVLGYYPPPQERLRTYRGHAVWHDLEVSARVASFRVYARPGYYRSDIDRTASTAAVQAGVELLGANEAADSLFAFERALQEDPYNWQAYFYRGRAYGVLGRIEDAQADFLAAARVGAGVGPVHQFASIASADLEDFETAWEHAIRAQQAGINMQEHFDALQEIAPAPADLQARLAAPRLYVGPALVPDPEAQAVLDAVLRAIRLAVSESHAFGLVTQPQTADYYLRLQVSSVETDVKPRVKGALELLRTSGDRLYDDGFTLQDVFDDVTTGRVLSGKLRELADWLERH
jgi:Ca-activated chloride channel family protein